MEANKTKQLIYELMQIAFGNRDRDNKRLQDMANCSADEIEEMERLSEIGEILEWRHVRTYGRLETANETMPIKSNWIMKFNNREFTLEFAKSLKLKSSQIFRIKMSFVIDDIKDWLILKTIKKDDRWLYGFIKRSKH